MKRTARQMQMGGVAREAMAPVASSLRAAVESVLGSVSIADLSFPDAFACHGETVHQFLLMPRPEMEARFLQRFRQAGGHAPISSVDLSVESVVWPDRLRQLEGTTVIYLASFDEWQVHCAKFSESGCAVLVSVPLDMSGSRLAAKAQVKDFRVGALLESRKAMQRYALLLPRHMESPAPQFGGLRKVLFETGETQLVIDAGAMIHDGGYVSEGDIKYSWLWTGPSTHFRLVMPQIAGARPRHVEVCIPRAEDHTNLDRVAVQIDGRPTRFRVERWSETSGKLCVDVPAGQSYCVMTIVTPALTTDTNSGRQIGLCLDRLIVT